MYEKWHVYTDLNMAFFKKKLPFLPPFEYSLTAYTHNALVLKYYYKRDFKDS